MSKKFGPTHVIHSSDGKAIEKIQPEKLITHRFYFDDMLEAFNVFE